MKLQSIQFKFLITVISAMLAITIFIGGLSIYEVDHFVQSQTEDFVNVTCEKDAAQINDIFGDMENSVHIMESYVYGLMEDGFDIKTTAGQADILDRAHDMFVDVAKHANGAVAYYLRFAPEISHGASGFFHTKIGGRGDFIDAMPTDLSRYNKSDTSHVGWYWQARDAGEPVWMLPYYNENNDIFMISYVVPLYDGSEFVGLVGMDFDYTVLTDRVHEMRIYEHGFAHLEHEGAVIHSENAENEDQGKFLEVSKSLKNGMTLVLSASYNDIREIRYNIAYKILFVVLLLALLFSLIVIFVVRKIVRPLKTLTDAAIKLADGDYEVEITHCHTREINLLSTAFENMTRNLREHERLQHLLAYRDSLTGLRNTNSYWAWITDFDKEIATKEIVFGVLVCDINYLKETNDRYGHDVGNQLIVSAARIISETFKRSPVFRIGGDEFLVLLQNRDLEELTELLKKFDESCGDAVVEVETGTIPVSIAKGFAKYDSEKDATFIDVFNRADDAMYENKRAIKGAGLSRGK